MSDRFISPISLCGGPRAREGRGTHQIVRDDAEADPAMHAVFTMVATAVESMSALEYTDSAFRADAPPLPATEPALALKRLSCRRLRAAAWQDHASNTAIDRRLFIGRGAETTVARGQIWRAAKERLMAIQRGCPQGHISRSPGMDVVARNDLMLGFLDGHQLAELVRFRNLALSDRFRVRLEDAEDFVRDVGVAAQDACARLGEYAGDERPHLPQLILRAAKRRLYLRCRCAHTVSQSANHRGRVTHDGTGRRHQLGIAQHQRRSRLRRSRLVADDQHAAHYTTEPIADSPFRITQRR